MISGIADTFATIGPTLQATGVFETPHMSTNTKFVKRQRKFLVLTCQLIMLTIEMPTLTGTLLFKSPIFKLVQSLRVAC